MSTRVRPVNSKGTGLGITEDGRKMLLANVRARALAEAMEKGLAFTCSEDAVTPDGAASVFAVVQNNSVDPLVIDRIRLNDAGAEVITAEVLAAFTHAGGAALTAVNRKVGSALTFASKGTFYGGTTVTGQGAAVELERLKTAAGVDKELDLSEGAIVLLQHQALQLKAATGTAALSYSIDCWWATIPTVNG